MPNRAQLRDLGRGSWVRLIPAFVAGHAELMQRLLLTLPLRQETLTMFGKTHLTPRLTSWHGDPGCAYRYSRRLFEPNAWTPELSEVRERVSENSGYVFNSVLVNHYRDGRDAMGAHADDEPELGPRREDVGVASVSLGGRRRFLLRRKEGGDTIEYAPGEGDLLLMGGRTQQQFKHWVPRTGRPTQPRMNLTFRVVLTD